jgi:hypothetical protein
MSVFPEYLFFHLIEFKWDKCYSDKVFVMLDTVLFDLKNFFIDLFDFFVNFNHLFGFKIIFLLDNGSLFFFNQLINLPFFFNNFFDIVNQDDLNNIEISIRVVILENGSNFLFEINMRIILIITRNIFHTNCIIWRRSNFFININIDEFLWSSKYNQYNHYNKQTNKIKLLASLNFLWLTVKIYSVVQLL